MFNPKMSFTYHCEMASYGHSSAVSWGKPDVCISAGKSFPWVGSAWSCTQGPSNSNLLQQPNHWAFEVKFVNDNLETTAGRSINYC